MTDKELTALAADPFLNEIKTLPIPARQIRKIKDGLKQMTEAEKIILIFTEQSTNTFNTLRKLQNDSNHISH